MPQLSLEQRVAALEKQVAQRKSEPKEEAAKHKQEEEARRTQEEAPAAAFRLRPRADDGESGGIALGVR